MCKIQPFLWRKKSPDPESLSVARQINGSGVPIRLIQIHPHPVGLEFPSTDGSRRADPLDRQTFPGQRDCFAGFRPAKIGAKNKPDQRHIQTEEPCDRPCAGCHENQADNESDSRNKRHQEHKTTPVEAYVRLQDCGKQITFASPGWAVTGCHDFLHGSMIGRPQ